ncbi:MAG: hypothetical protein JXD18_11245 [Anaerolineae bacterium]|nr:hypothetical protein [Anaerolineae bacterium]
MPLLTDFDLTLTADQVLRGQGADPEKVRARSPKLVETAEKALRIGVPLLDPQVLYQEMRVEALRHQRLNLVDGGVLQGELVAQHLAAADTVVVMLCTIGERLEQAAAELSSTNIIDGLALDGVGSAGVEALANLACRRFEMRAAEAGLQATIPISPGMVGWPIEEGQPQIFALLDAQQVGVSLSPPTYMMRPRKSLTMVIGVGADVRVEGSTCDYCTMRETCQYRTGAG